MTLAVRNVSRMNTSGPKGTFSTTHDAFLTPVHVSYHEDKVKPPCNR